MSDYKKLRELITVNYDPFVISLLNKYNPLSLTNEDGKSCFFQQTFECYLKALSTAYQLSPIGYMETDWYLQQLYPHLTIRDCGKIANTLLTLDVPDVSVNEWDSKEGRKYLEGVIIGLSSILELKYDSYSFNQAYDLLMHRMEMDKLKQKLDKENEQKNK